MQTKEVAGTGGKRIMVVEDDPDAAEVTCLLLRILGHDCRSATSGRAALELASELRPEVVLVDIGLPDICGYEVGRALRGDSPPSAMHLIALTGFCGPEHRARSVQAGFDQYLVKPVGREALAEAIARTGSSARVA